MKKRKRAFYTIILILLVCGGNAMADQTITPERLTEISGVQEEYSTGNLAELIKRYGLTEQFFAELEEEEIADTIRVLFATPYLNCYTYLFSADAWNPSEWSYTDSNVLRVATFLNYGLLNECIMIDFESKKIYYDENRYFFSDISKAGQEIDMTTELLASITDILKDVPQPEWKYAYEGTQGIDSSDWYLAFETSEGIIRYSIMGSAQDVPEELTGVAYDLLQLFEKR